MAVIYARWTTASVSAMRYISFWRGRCTALVGCDSANKAYWRAPGFHRLTYGLGRRVSQWISAELAGCSTRRKSCGVTALGAGEGYERRRSPNVKKAQTEAWAFFESGAGNEARTRDLNLGKVALYQLSYSRVCWQLVCCCKTKTITWKKNCVKQRSAKKSASTEAGQESPAFA